MVEQGISDKRKIEVLLRERKELYHRTVMAEHRREELSAVDSFRITSSRRASSDIL